MEEQGTPRPLPKIEGFGYGGKKSAPHAVAVSSTAPVLLIAANTQRASATIQNNAATVLYIGSDMTLTAANGIAVPAGQSAVDKESRDDWYGLQASGIGDARLQEVIQ